MKTVGKYKQTTGLWWKRQRIIVKIVIVAIVFGGVLFLVRQNSKNDLNTTEVVKRMDVVRTVNASGSVVSSTDLALSFETNKMINSVKVKVGNTVKKGDILATQKSATERASYTSARGSLLAAQARYKKVLDGSSNEEIALAQINLDTTKKVQDGLVEQARRKLLSDGLVAESEDTTPINGSPVIGGTYTGAVEGDYRIYFELNSKEARFSGLEKGTVTVSAVPVRLGTKGLTISFPVSQYSSGDSYRVHIPNQSGVNFTSNTNAYSAAIDTRDALVATRQAELNLKRATARQADVDAALADIVTAQASLEGANAALERTILRAPADGTITRVDVKVGVVPDNGSTAIVLQDVSNLYLEANVNESYIGQLIVGQTVMVTFDALSGTAYRATLSSVDPAATVTDGIVNYKVKALLGAVDKVLPGMTADMVITTGSANAVLTLPGRVITSRDNQQYVTVQSSDNRHKTQKRVVTTGLRGDGDIVEITSGVTQGEIVLWKPDQQ